MAGRAERARSPMPMPSPTVRPAGKQHSHGGRIDGAGDPGRLAAREARDSGHVLPGGGADRRRRSKRQVRWALSSARDSVRRSSSAVTAAARGGYCRQAWGKRGHSRAGCPNHRGIPGTGYDRARTGAVCARDAHGQRGWQRAAGRRRRGAFAGTGSRQRRAVAEGSIGRPG
jgi:hypothetical protein